MKHTVKAKLLSVALSAALLLSSPVAALKTAAASKPKYVSEVFIAYGRDEAEARQWLIDNGWEPVEGDFNAGKKAVDVDPVAAVMGIHRTANANEAITDMAVMNMGEEGNMGYSFDDYKRLLDEKKALINEFVDSFMPAIQEYRDNYNGKGSAAGKARAELAHDMLNKFYDGEVDGKYAVNDTGVALGDLLLHETRREYGEDKYDKLDKNDRTKYGDLQQILLESTGAAVNSIEQALSLATDSGSDSWLDRLSETSGMSLGELAEIYAGGSDTLSDSAAESLLQTKYGDAAKTMADEYMEVRQQLKWYTAYMDNHDLWQHDDEDAEAYTARENAYFDALKAKDEAQYEDDNNNYLAASFLYELLAVTDYKGKWGSTLLDFFLPEDDADYGAEMTNFLPFAAVLTAGQRAGLQFISFSAMLRLGTSNATDVAKSLPGVDEYMADYEPVSVYSGVNRAIFRDGVALTNRAMMEKSRGRNPYDELWGMDSAFSVIAISTLTTGLFLAALGTCLYCHFDDLAGSTSTQLSKLQSNVNALNKQLSTCKTNIDTLRANNIKYVTSKEYTIEGFNTRVGTLNEAKNKYLDLQTKQKLAKTEVSEMEGKLTNVTKMSNAARVMLCIGGVMLLAGAVMNTVQLYHYYNRDFTIIPMMIVDEADIVTYVMDKDGNPVLDEHGNPKKNIDFNQFAYYEVVRCNRQAIGVNIQAQDGVDQYAAWGCGDAADLNADIGKQWLALYTVKEPSKGAPILADSFKLQGKNDTMPTGCNNNLHFFTYSYAADIADEAYCYDSSEGSLYLFWQGDENAYTASTFTTGQLALAGIGGLVVGILGASVVMFATRKKETPDAPAAA